MAVALENGVNKHPYKDIDNFQLILWEGFLHFAEYLPDALDFIAGAVSNKLLRRRIEFMPVLSSKEIIGSFLQRDSELLANRIQTDTDMISEKQASHVKGASIKLRRNFIMMRKYEAVKISVMMNKKCIRPVMLLEDISQFLVGVPARGDGRGPFYGGAVSLEARVADVRLGTEFRERVVIGKIGF